MNHMTGPAKNTQPPAIAQAQLLVAAAIAANEAAVDAEDAAAVRLGSDTSR